MDKKIKKDGIINKFNIFEKDYMYNKYIDKKFYFRDAAIKHIYKNRQSHSIQHYKC